MNVHLGAIDPSIEKFAVGQPVPRNEDPKLLRGEGRYTDDVSMPDQVYAVMVRSVVAHGVLKGIDVAAARTMPGVLGVYTAADLKEYGVLNNVTALTSKDGSKMKGPARPILASDKVRFLGDPVAFVVARSVEEAKDAAEAVMVDIDALPAVTSPSIAAKPGAPQLYDDAPGNVAMDFHFGDEAKVNAAFAQAAHVTRLPLANNRVVICAMEPRAGIGMYDKAAGRWTLYAPTQGVSGIRDQLAKEILKTTPDKVRVVTGNVGGSFGMKHLFSEYVCILHAARELGVPVKWTDDRSGSFLSDSHGRAAEVTGELALDKDGKFLAVRITGYSDIGGYATRLAPLFCTLNFAKNGISVYRTPLFQVSVKVMYTNAHAIGPYRGAGRPEGNYFMERLVEAAAAEMKIDPIELRLRNHIQNDQFPYQTSVGTNYDSGDFSALLKEALDVADWKGFDKRKADSKTRGRLRGRGVSNFLEVTAPLGKELGGIRFEADGTVTMVSGTLDYGQGLGTAFAQLLSAKLGVPHDRFVLKQDDSDVVTFGTGSGGSKSTMCGGIALVMSSDKVIEQGKELAAHALEAAAADIEFTRGQFRIAGTDRSIGILDLAAKIRAGLKLPEGAPKSLDVHMTHDVPNVATYPNGCHIVEVEIDPETGVVEVAQYASVNDFGVMVNPLIVEGQVHGGVVQGIGQALYESTVYDEETGQLLSGSFMDYALPRAGDVSRIGFVSHPSPATTNMLGTKGCGEAGCAGALPSVMNAVVDALRNVGVDHIDMPATPHKVWQAIQAARKSGKAPAHAA